MAIENMDDMGTEELNELRSKAESLKNDTQEFVTLARKLSDEGVKDAKKLLDFAKTNWKTILGSALALGAGGAALTAVQRTGKGKTSSKKAAGVQAKTTAKSARKVAGAATKKTAKKVSKKASKKA